MRKKAWIVSVNMGYGHQRTAFPLRSLAPDGEIINANDYSDIPEKDRKIWETSRRFYEFVSKFKRVPVIGAFTFFLFDQIQKIFSFYPKRDLSKPNIQLTKIYSLIKGGWGAHLIKKLKEKNIPLITTFFTPAFMAEYFNYPNDIFCIICDTDISRTWAPLSPKSSKIKYFAPNIRVVERLKLYGVKSRNIFFTGFPLPINIVGTEKFEIVRRDLGYRMLNLDPQKKYFQTYEPLIKKYIGKLPPKTNHPLTLMFAVGGAGAQKEIGIKILRSLKRYIEEKEIKIILVAGTRKGVRDYFEEKIKKLRLEKNQNIEIIFEKNIFNYFKKFNKTLRKTDILWTKPSELSFYTALGLPIIIAPPIGSQEEFNKRWLDNLGSGLYQKNPNYVHQWLFDFLNAGWLAEAAMQGFIEAENLGVLNIEKIISKK